MALHQEAGRIPITQYGDYCHDMYSYPGDAAVDFCRTGRDRWRKLENAARIQECEMEGGCKVHD